MSRSPPIPRITRSTFRNTNMNQVLQQTPPQSPHDNNTLSLNCTINDQNMLTNCPQVNEVSQEGCRDGANSSMNKIIMDSAGVSVHVLEDPTNVLPPVTGHRESNDYHGQVSESNINSHPVDILNSTSSQYNIGYNCTTNSYVPINGVNQNSHRMNRTGEYTNVRFVNLPPSTSYQSNRTNEYNNVYQQNYRVLEPQTGQQNLNPLLNRDAYNCIPQNHNNFYPSIKFNLPTFSGEREENPVEYIEKLEAYFINNFIPNSHHKYVIEQTLTGVASHWFSVFKQFCNNFVSFKGIFLNEYWNFAQHQKIKVALYSDLYSPQKNPSMADYYISLYKQCKQLNPPISDSEFNAQIRRHFPIHIQRVLLTIHGESFLHIYNMLKELDEIEHNRTTGIMRTDNRNSNRGYNFNKNENSNQQSGGNFRTLSNNPNKPYNNGGQPENKFNSNKGAIPKSQINSIEICNDSEYVSYHDPSEMISKNE